MASRFPRSLRKGWQWNRSTAICVFQLHVVRRYIKLGLGDARGGAEFRDACGPNIFRGAVNPELGRQQAGWRSGASRKPRTP